MDLRYPPTLSSLLDDERYYNYLGRRPKFSTSWLVMAHTTSLTWKRGLFDKYSIALQKVTDLMDDDSIRDISIISRGHLSKEPKWMPVLYSSVFDKWCARCRRPTLYLISNRTPPAFINAPALVKGAKRCFFCGAREELACPTSQR